MDNETVDRTFTPAAREALAAFPIDAEDLTLVSLSENVTFKVTDRRDAALMSFACIGRAITRSKSWSPSAPGSGRWLRSASMSRPLS